MKIDNLDAIAPRIAEVAPKRRLEFQFVFFGKLLPDFFELLFIANHDSEMAHVYRLDLFHFENGEKLMLAEFKEGVAFAFLQLLQIEDVFVKRDRLLDVVHFDGDVIAAVNFDAPPVRRPAGLVLWRARTAHFRIYTNLLKVMLSRRSVVRARPIVLSRACYTKKSDPDDSFVPGPAICSSNFAMDRQTTLDQLEQLLPLAAQWATEQERRVLCEGVPLSGTEIADARAIGVRNPERVRLLRVDSVPVPAHPVLRAAAASINFLSATPSGLALNYGIFIRADRWRERTLIAHELVHIAQYQRLGGIMPFLQTYICQCATVGYRQAPLELEADAVAARVCNRSAAQSGRGG